MKTAELLRFNGAVERNPAIDAWMKEHAGELGAIAQQWLAGVPWMTNPSAPLAARSMANTAALLLPGRAAAFGRPRPRLHRANLLTGVAHGSEVMSVGIWLRNLFGSQRSGRRQKRNH